MPPRAPLSASSIAKLPTTATPIVKRHLQSSRPGHACLTAGTPPRATTAHFPSFATAQGYQQQDGRRHSPLASLPLAQVLRTYLMTAVSSSPTLLAASSKLLTRLLHSDSWLTDVERNPVIRLALRESFYKQFCAGEDKASARQYMQQLEAFGYHGVILEYALEVLKEAQGSNEASDIDVWRKGMLQSVDMTRSGDCIGLKWSGLGGHALQRLKAGDNPSPLMESAMREVCDAAAAKAVRLLPSAEEIITTPAYHDWTIKLQREYNRGPTATLYNTYQAYLKQCSGFLAAHLADAQKEGYTLGVKLVRGAYLATEPRDIIWGSKQETDDAYDATAAALLRRRYEGPVQPLAGADTKAFPSINVLLATHNALSTRKAQAVRRQQLAAGEPLVPLIYAQLQGMADEISCELLAQGREPDNLDPPQVFKCATWGTMSQCLNYLLRRAAENQDAATRTRESRAAMGQELARRARAVFGFI